MFQWVYLQVVYLCDCLPKTPLVSARGITGDTRRNVWAHVREIKKVSCDFAHHLLQCVAVAIRALQLRNSQTLLHLTSSDRFLCSEMTIH